MQIQRKHHFVSVHNNPEEVWEVFTGNDPQGFDGGESKAIRRKREAVDSHDERVVRFHMCIETYAKVVLGYKNVVYINDNKAVFSD